MSEQPCLIELERVGKRFAADGHGETNVLEGVDLCVAAGEIVALVGKSGCGKSTLLRIVAGLSLPTGGAVRYRGQPVTGPMPGIAMVFQSFALFPWLSVQENVELGLEARGVAREERARRAREVIDMIGLKGFESAYPRELSGGMRQRVGFARALVMNPDVLLMDEAFSALDVPTAETLRGDLLDLWLERLIPTQAILMVSHNIEEAVLMADRIVVMDANPGRIKAELAVPLKHPRDRDARAFRSLVDRVYTVMTTAVSREGARLQRIDLGFRLPNVSVAQLLGVLERIQEEGEGGRVELPPLAEALHFEVDDLFPILDALELLDLVQISGRSVGLTRHGQAFLEADMSRRKEIFGEHLMKRIPLAAHIRRVLDERPSRRAPEQRFLRELEDYMSEEDAKGVLSVVIDWARYAELFAYDYNSGILSIAPDEEEDEEPS